MIRKANGGWKPLFTLNHLKRLPVSSLIESEKLRVVYAGFEDLATRVLFDLGITYDGRYADFLSKQAYDTVSFEWSMLKEIGDKEGQEKEWWFHKSLHLVMGSIIVGHDRIDDAYRCLKAGDSAGFAGHLSEAGVYFGRLTMVYDLNHDDDLFNRIGSLKSALSGASLGGKKSGLTRRKQSRVPTPHELRIARQKLVDAGKPTREIAAMLAKKYDCTTDYIRKILKRE